jgi:hypothetical protein
MKPIKRILAISLLLALCFTLSACATGNENVLGVTYPTTPLDTASGGSAAQSDDAIAAGEVYRNEYFQFNCNLSVEWYVLNPDELLPNARCYVWTRWAAVKRANSLQDSFNNGDTQMDFYTINTVDVQTINVVLSKAKILEVLLSDQQLLKASVPLLTSGLTDMGATDIQSDVQQITFLGKDRAALIVEANYQGSPIQETIFVIRQGGYLASITITDMTGSPTTDYVDYFQVIE